MWRAQSCKSLDLGKCASLGGSREKYCMLEPTVSQAKGRLLNEERNLQQGFQQWGFFCSNQVGKEQLKVMGVIRKEELCWVSTNLTFQYASVWAAKCALKLLWRDIYNPGGSHSLLIVTLKTKVWWIPDTKRVFNFNHLGCVVWMAGFFDANPAVVVSKPLCPFMFPGCKEAV